MLWKSPLLIIYQRSGKVSADWKLGSVVPVYKDVRARPRKLQTSSLTSIIFIIPSISEMCCFSSSLLQNLSAAM